MLLQPRGGVTVRSVPPQRIPSAVRVDIRKPDEHSVDIGVVAAAKRQGNARGKGCRAVAGPRHDGAGSTALPQQVLLSVGIEIGSTDNLSCEIGSWAAAEGETCREGSFVPDAVVEGMGYATLITARGDQGWQALSCLDSY